jgi:hypothetical protein
VSWNSQQAQCQQIGILLRLPSRAEHRKAEQGRAGERVCVAIVQLLLAVLRTPY